MGQRIAGGLLIANAALVFLSAALVPSNPASTPLSLPGVMIVPAIIDALIGISLLAGNKSVLPWAIVRVVLGLIIMTAVQASQDLFLAVLQVVVSGSFLLLLLGDASKPRMAVGSAFFGMYALICVIGLSATVTGRNPIAVLLLGMSGQIERDPAGVVTGASSHYRLHAPSDKWHLRKPEVAKKDNALADRWLTRPELDAHVIVIAEKVPGMRVRPDGLADAVVANAKRMATEFEIVGREPLQTHPQTGRIVHTRSKASGLELETLSGTVAVYEHGFQIIAFAPRKSYAEVEAELRSIIESFELPTDELPGLPADVEPTPASRVEGQSQAYVLTAPSDRWYVRKDEAAKKDNSLADRWIVRPDEDAHIFVVAEYAPNAVVDVERYADAVENIIKTNLQGTIESREPLKENPKIGRILHVKATVNGLPLEYYYGLFARGERAFQVIAFTHQDSFPRLADELMKAITTFEMPAVTETK